MKIFLFILFQVQFVLFDFGQSGVPYIDWTHAGLANDPQPEVPTIDFGMVQNSFSSVLPPDVVMSQIIRENPNGAIVFFPGGEYTFNKQIKLPSSYILQGDTSGETVLIFELEKEEDCILIRGNKRQQELYLAKDAEIGSTSLVLTENHAKNIIKKGDYLYLGDDDADIVTSSWAIGKSGQFVRVAEVDGSKISIETAVRRSFLTQDSACVTLLSLVSNVGIENLTIKNKTKTAGQTANIQFQFASNCWVNNIKSLNCNYSHVLLEYAVNCAVLMNEFRDAHDHGNGGKGYGVTLQFGTSDCYVAENYADHLRHAFLLQAGANGNVILENTASNAFWTGVRLPEDSSGDIVLHGNYVYANLIERNKCGTIVIDNSHGNNGPGNLFFQNELYGYGIIVNKHAAPEGCAFINNSINSKGFFKGKYRIKGNHYEQYNVVNSKIKPRGTVRYDQKGTFTN